MTELHAKVGKRKASFRETWYGEAEPYRGGYRLIVLVGPEAPKKHRHPDTCLVFNVGGKELIPGPMVVATERRVWMPKDWWDLPVNTGVVIPPGAPETLVDISFDPSKTDGHGGWQGRLKGNWPVRLTKVRRKSLWARLRG